MYKCQGERCANGNRSYRYLNLTPLVIGVTEKVIPETSVLNVGRPTMEESGQAELSDKNKSSAEEERNVEAQPFEDGWIETCTRKMCTAQSSTLLRKSTPLPHLSLSCFWVTPMASTVVCCFALPVIPSTTVLVSATW